MENSVATIDPLRFRSVMGNYPTGVTSITSLDREGQPVGMTVGTFTSVSLDPPLVAFLPDKKSTTFPKIREAGYFCANILGAHQESVCRSLARKGAEKFTSIDWVESEFQTPRIQGSIAWIECDIVEVYEAGDHYIVIGAVKELDSADSRPPLLFFQGGYGRFASISLTAPAEADLLQPLRLVDQAREEMSTIAEDLGVECFTSAAIGTQLVLLGNAVARSLDAPSHQRLGQRMPFNAPLGLPIIAWSDDEQIKEWSARSNGNFDQAGIREMTQRVRSRGWSVVLRSDEQVRFERAINDLPLKGATREQTDELLAAVQALNLEGYEPTDIRDDEEYRVRYISAPVFGADGDVVLMLSLYQLPNRLSGREIARYRDRLVEGAQAVTAKLSSGAPGFE
ncbi:flavin reductase [Pseudarthrobacter sp. IC2-21]|uniref:flavin reductase n=1 Tax=Pseudarthrobacter sp. IC2-21 TaxID=3092262 RepID=UPI002A6AEE2B|nr:flavin reductase [Pseudarthrobacter sp. IC2-21]